MMLILVMMRANCSHDVDDTDDIDFIDDMDGANETHGID